MTCAVVLTRPPSGGPTSAHVAAAPPRPRAADVTESLPVVFEVGAAGENKGVCVPCFPLFQADTPEGETCGLVKARS